MNLPEATYHCTVQPDGFRCAKIAIDHEGETLLKYWHHTPSKTCSKQAEADAWRAAAKQVKCLLSIKPSLAPLHREILELVEELEA